MADVQNRRTQAARRTRLSTLSTSTEEQESFTANAAIAESAYAVALAQLNQAKINLERTKVMSPVNGYVTNLQG